MIKKRRRHAAACKIRVALEAFEGRKPQASYLFEKKGNVETVI